MQFFSRSCLSAIAFLCVLNGAQGHPIPDIPVRSSFDGNGNCRIAVEIDIRCFSEDALNEPFLLKWVLDEMEEPERDDLKLKAAALIEEGVAFRFEPSLPLAPDFDFAFTGPGGVPLEKIDDAVMLTGTWESPVPGDAKGYQVEALTTGKFDLVFRNTINGAQVERFQVLFPGETSYLLGLTTPVIVAIATPSSAAAVPGTEAPPALYLPIILITVVIAAALIALRRARRERGR